MPQKGVGSSFGSVAAGYYWKDVQRVQPAASQFYQGVVNVPWVVKPLWGLFTDVVPVAGYRRRPYLLLAGVMGVSSMLTLALRRTPAIAPALVAFTTQAAGAAIADVVVDAMVAQNSISHPPLAADMQSLCGYCSSAGALVGYSISGLVVHAIGSQGALGLLSIPSVLVFSAGILVKEDRAKDFEYNQVHRKFYEAVESMWETLKCPQGFIGLIYSIGSVGSLLGVLLYQNMLKDYPFRGLLLWGQLLACLSGMIDLVLVTRLNLRLGMPDYLFAVMDNSVSQLIGQLKWLPLLVLCSKLCPVGIEGTFFALLMSIQNLGLLMSAWWGGLLLHALGVTRTEFGNLWVAVLARNAMRLLPLAFLFLVPRSDQNSTILPAEMLLADGGSPGDVEPGASGAIEFSVLHGDEHTEFVETEEEELELTPLMEKI
ncbi:unnamed protein product [Triticum turgidum subsp. durum]|uniref:Uncharacterized protein n=1 Tax=Triticum turgidum subsp. durum TaxID=4567 RepID=A0A9R1RDB7_TRITD|nr:unnamed protein product [Triticum turgidum subsp. durum]